jgi:hypothetical protein
VSVHDAGRAPDEDAPGPPSWPSVVTSPILLSGLYAWSVAVAPAIVTGVAAVLRGGPTIKPTLGMVAALLAPLALVAGVVLDRRRSTLAPWVGVWCFLGLSVATWTLAPASADAGRVDALRGLLGTTGFLLYALAWGVPDVFRRTNPDDDPRADISTPLPARDRLSRAAWPVAGLGIGTVVALFAFSWRVQDGPRALLAHALAGLGAVLIVSAAAEVALSRRDWVPPKPVARLRRASGAIALLVLSGSVAVAYFVVSR